MLPLLGGVEAPDVVRGLDIGDGDSLPLKCCGDRELERGLAIGGMGEGMFLAT